MELRPYLFCLSFYLLYFFLPPFEDNGLLFWVSDVLCRYSEVVLWNLLSVQMFFWWICGGEIGLPVLFLCHLRTTSLLPIVLKDQKDLGFVNSETYFHGTSFYFWKKYQKELSNKLGKNSSHVWKRKYRIW